MYAGPTQRGMSERLTRASFAQYLGCTPSRTVRADAAVLIDLHRGLHMPLIIVIVNARGASPVSAFADGVGACPGAGDTACNWSAHGDTAAGAK